MNLSELQRIAAAVGQRRGWDFSPVRDVRDPVPWDYAEVVRRYLQPTSRVLDLGTGGGERFLALAPYFDVGAGIDIDPEMIRVAQENTPAERTGRISFAVMDARALQFPAASFDVVLNRHSQVCVEEVVRVVRLGGYFISQQVGPRNAHNICAVFGCGPGGEYKDDPSQAMPALVDSFDRLGCAVVAQAQYDVRYWFCDLESFLFWLQALPMPEDLDLERHWRQIDRIIAECSTSKGIETNEQRQLLIVQKRRE